MESQLGELIEAIHRDGIQAAERKTADIVAAAQAQADTIVTAAKKEKRTLLAAAEKRIARWQQSAERQLAQAGENLIIALKERIMQLFNRLLHEDLQETLSPEQLGDIIGTIISQQIATADQATRAELSGDADMVAAIQRHLHGKLQPQLRQQLSFAPLPNSEHELILRFDGQHSGYQLSTTEITAVVQALLAPQLRALLNDRDQSAGAEADTGAD